MLGPTLHLWDGYPHTSPSLRPDVRKAQELLRHDGIDVAVDGYFGPATDEAVIQFQREKGLLKDGIVGSITWFALVGKLSVEVSFYLTTRATHDEFMSRQNREAKKYRAFILAAAKDMKVDACLLCGIGSRESHWGLALRPEGPDGTGDFIHRTTPRAFRPESLPPDGQGFGRGLMQIDFDAHEFARGDGWEDPEKNIAYGARVLHDNMRFFRGRVDGSDTEHIIEMAVAAYNCGPGNVQRALKMNRDIDYYTHGRNYSKDVLDRAGWFKLNGW